jgi:competence protein ComEA
MSGLRKLLLMLALAGASSVARAEAPAAPTGVVNITSASAEELERLPGIGEKKAAAIVEHRRGHPLRRLEDLTRVKGIGRKTVARLRPYLSLTGPTTLKERPHRASK